MASKKTLDFSQVRDQSGFSPKHKPEGEYLATIVSFDDTKSKSGNDMWVFGIALQKDRKAIYPQYCLLGAEHLWKLRNLLLACGISVPKKKLTVDGNRLVGKSLGVCLEDDEYEGKKKSVVTSVFPASEFEGVPGDEDDENDEDAEEEYEDEEETEDDVEDEAPEDDEDDEEDEEEEPAPTPKKKPAAPARTSKAPARAKPKAKPAPAEEDEDDDLDVDDLEEEPPY